MNKLCLIDFDLSKSTTNRMKDFKIKLTVGNGSLIFIIIEFLNDEKLALLNDKELMANQLMTMNDLVSKLTQQVDSQDINVSDLNNPQRRNNFDAKRAA